MFITISHREMNVNYSAIISDLTQVSLPQRRIKWK